MSISALSLREEQLYRHLSSCCTADSFDLNSTKQYLLSSVNEMTSTRRSFSHFNSAARTVKFDAEKKLLKDLNNGYNDRNSIILALCRYHLSLCESSVRERSNTAQFLKQTAQAFHIEYIPAQLNQGKKIVGVPLIESKKMFGIANYLSKNTLMNYEGQLTDFSDNDQERHTKYLEDGTGMRSQKKACVPPRIYTGEFKKGQTCGQGKLLTDTGDTIEGKFDGDDLTGCFDVVYGSGGDYKGYKGDIIKGASHGAGILTRSDGTVLEGQFFNLILQVEKGVTITLTDGRVFTGKINSRTLSGIGALTTASGITIEGTFDAGKLKGLGKLQWPSIDNVTYEGEIVNEVPCGNGKLTIKNQEYVGDWHGTLFNKENVPNDFICCITMQLMNDPVNPTSASTSSSFVDRNSLYKSVLNKPINPITQSPLTLRQVCEMKTDMELQQKISKWRADNIKEIRTLFEQNEVAVPLEYQ